ncbi:MAG: AAA family ATPase [Chloroflexi bacterium]|nr:MAG: AAA family ATPase [Chloroflexota bacterium]
MDVLQGLNPAQREAVETIEGPLLILAGPGSGKTRVITHRIAYLVKVWHISPRRIMAVTFTNKAAREMKERLHRLVGRSAQEATVGTFHAICAAILRRDGRVAGIDPSFVIYDEEDQIGLIKRSLQDLGIDPKRYPPKAFHSAIDQAKSQLITPEAYDRQQQGYFGEAVQRVYRQYQTLLDQNHALDFDDLIVRTYYLFQSHPEVLSKYQSRYLHVLVDEFQDTNVAQYAVVKQIGGKYRNICVVGDPDQSIYSWRHADLRNILRFEKDYPESKVVYLEQSYRSTKTILEAAHQVISVNRDRKEHGLWTANDVGTPIRVVSTLDESDEAHFVVAEIQRLVSQREARHSDCVVMYRTHAQSRALEEMFLRYGIPYQLVGGTRFYERREVKDVVAYLRLIRNPYDSVSLARVINTPPRGIGKKTIDDLLQWTKSLGIAPYTGLNMIASDEPIPHFSGRTAQALAGFFHLLHELIEASREHGVADLIDLLVRKTGYQHYLLEMDDGDERWENVMELHGIARELQHLSPRESLDSFLDGVTLFTEADRLDDTRDAVTLITLHQAKGLEYPIVFIVGMEEGVLPHFRSFDDPGQMEEERRLCYVGMTRTKSRLYLVNAMRRRLMGGLNANPPSRFLQDIPPRLVESAKLVEGEAWPAPVADRETSLEAGDYVQHARFGEGVVLSCHPARGDQEIVVDFGNAGTKRLLLSLAPLRKIDG